LKSVDKTLEHTKRDGAGLQHDVVAVNDNGVMLLQWFRSLPERERAGIVRVATGVTARLRH